MTGARVYITVNPGLIAGKRFQTVRSMVTALHDVCDLFVIPIDEIDFEAKRVSGYRRVSGGKFESVGELELRADLWVIYTDGYYYNSELEFIRQQLQFYDELLSKGMVSHMVNLPEAERHTLKDWFVGLDCRKLSIIPTFAVHSFDELRARLRAEKRLVLKPIWGGASLGVRKLESERDIEGLRSEQVDLSEFVLQSYRTGPEKRLWFVGQDCVGGRIVYRRKTPWSGGEAESGAVYDSGAEFERDRPVATRVWELSGLSIGSVDFIGGEVNEINGCGTTFVYYDGWTRVADARPALVAYLRDLASKLSK